MTPEQVDKLITFGQMALEQGWYDQAREYFEQALELDTTNQEAIDGLARVDEIPRRKASFEPAKPEVPVAKPAQPEKPEIGELLDTAQKDFEAGYEQARGYLVQVRKERFVMGYADSVVVDATDLAIVLLAVLDVIKEEGLSIVKIRQSLEALGHTSFRSFFDEGKYESRRRGFQDTLHIKAKRKLLEQIDINVRSSGVMFTPDTDLAMHIAAVFQSILDQSILETRQYPTDSKQIIDYAKQRLEEVWEFQNLKPPQIPGISRENQPFLEGLFFWESQWKDQQELFLEFLENWIQQAEIISRLAERIDEEPLNPNAHFELAEAIFFLGRPDAAKRYYTMALVLEPGPRVAGVANLRLGSMMPASGRLGGRAQILADWEEARHRFEQAVGSLEEYLRTNPNDPEAWRELSDAYSYLGSVYDPSRLSNPWAKTVALGESGRAGIRAWILQPLPSVQEKAPEAPLKHEGGLAFEEKCLRLIRAMGFHAQTTKQTGDGGIDIIATSTQPLLAGKFVIQCKDWSAPVGVSPVRDLYGVVTGERANKGILMTSSTFTKPAQDFAQGKQLELIDGEELERLYRIHVEKRKATNAPNARAIKRSLSENGLGE